MNEQLKIVVVGDVDSGKSTLIGRLLFDAGSITNDTKEGFKIVCKDLGKNLEFAYLLDSFKEEREEGFTLDTTQALLKTKHKDFLLVDVPGHREFLKNMLTGVSYADAAILLVDANSTLEEQTRRHIYILKFLGINEVILAINKMDSVSYARKYFDQNKEELIKFCKGICMKLIFSIPISAKKGDNLIKKSSEMNWYKGFSLIEGLNTLTKKSEIFDFRFPVQDIYEIKGEKIVVGTVASGRLNRKDLVRSSLTGQELRIKRILTLNKVKSNIGIGESIGIIFDSIDGLERGAVIYKDISPRVTNRFQAKIFCLSQLKKQERLVFRCVTQDTSARINEITESINTGTYEIRKNMEALEETYAADTVITTDVPVAIEKFQDLNCMGRFVLQKNELVCAAGIVY